MFSKNKQKLIKEVASLSESQQIKIRTSKTASELQNALTECGIDSPTTLPSWLVILLKVIAYAIGLLLAGYGTNAAAQSLFF